MIGQKNMKNYENYEKYSGIQGLINIVKKLRSEEGCPWDRKQTEETLKPYVIEEAYEVVDAIGSGEKIGNNGRVGRFATPGHIFIRHIRRKERIFIRRCRKCHN
jgi:Protein containing tetrapyrrole methyltransferase domain and MazG-like (predicted pyrophosphatase) domain